ncbi:Polysaccharide biosynthesis protein CpsM(V) [Streptococcus infantarius subsp. infantarius]|nr:Polysaccharide biosynthesis protein CpsM(V) [Streptococcus infantarius subsp. infantarius]MCO4689878.1 Polysaccharide biosynthesis protein CpsM(V) [Streptococcus infantarius subsp. infantarius]
MNNNFSFTIAKLLRRLPAKNLSDNFNMYRHRKIQNQLKPIFEKAFQSFTKYEKYNVNNTIWIFWWQGEDSMPDIVKKCYNSVQRFCGNKKIVLITKDNIRDYTDISENIYLKLNSGVITFTHFSDILRANLLKNNGGLWMDATMYVTNSLDNIELKELLYRVSQSKDTFNISFGRWTGFFMGGPSGMDIMSFMDRLYQCYWEEYDELIDYFLIDYALDYAWNKNLSEFKSLEYKYKNIDPHLFDMQKFLNSKYDEMFWNDLTRNTNLFKLSYKKKINEKDDNVYNHL